MRNSRFDDLLTKLGTGKWNVLYFITCGYREFLLPSKVFSGIFLAPDVGYTCLPQDLNVTDISEDSCSYYVNKTTPEGEIVREAASCTDWEFDTSVYTSTLTSEFKLVCGQAYLRATYQSISLWATLFSSPLMGYLADRYGRKTMVIMMQFPYYILLIVLALVTNFTVILAIRFSLGCFAVSGMYVFALEACEVKNRSWVGIVMVVPWALGTIAWGGMAYLIRDWRYLQLSVSLPGILMLLLPVLIDESPRWLIVKGYHARALNVLRKASRWNKAELPPDHRLKEIFLDIQQEQKITVKRTVKSESKQGSRHITSYLPTLIRTPKLRLRIVTYCTIFLISSLVYNGLSLSGDIYSSDPFLYVVISGLMELPSYTLTAPIINRLGRKIPAIVCYFFTGITILALAFIPSEWSRLVLTLAMIGKMFNSAAFMMNTIAVSELLPTEVRLRGVGIIEALGLGGSAVAPYITSYLGPIIPWFPSVLFGCTSFVAGLLLLPLPETLGKPMMDTVQELENQHPKKHSSHDLADEEQKSLTEISTTAQ